MSRESRAARVRNSRVRIHGVACGSCQGDAGQFPETVVLAGQQWPTCPTCWSNPGLVDHGVSKPVMAVVRDVNGGPDRLAPSIPAKRYAYYERSPAHRIAAALAVPLNGVAAVVAEHWDGPLIYADVEGAAPGDPAAKPWEFIGPDLRAKYDAAMAEATATTHRLPSPCTLCARTEAPRGVQVVEVPGPLGVAGHMDAICWNVTQEARNLGANPLDLRLSDHAGVSVRALDYGLTGPGAPGPQPFSGLDIPAIVADVQRRAEARQRAADGPPRPNVLRDRVTA